MTKTPPAWTLLALTAFLWLAAPAAAADKGVKERDVYVGTNP